MFDMMKGKFAAYSGRHDLCRGIQCCFRFGTEDMRSTILSELEGRFNTLSKDKYSSFMLIAFLRYSNDRQRNKILNEFRGHVGRLGTHNCGSRVLDFAFGHCDIEPAKRKKNVAKAKKDNKENGINRGEVHVRKTLQKLRTEFYGQEFAIFAAQTTSEKDENAEAEMFASLDLKKKRQTLGQLSRIVTKQAEKGILRYAFAQTVMWNLIRHCEALITELGPEEAKSEREMISNMIPLVAEACLAMVGSFDGAKSIVRCLAYATAKERKTFVRVLKGHVVNLCFHEFGYLVILALFNMVDDTVLLKKSIMPELADAQVFASLHETLQAEAEVSHAREVFLQLFTPANARYLPKPIVALIQPAAGTSKKSADARASELRPTILSGLVEMCTGNVDKLIEKQGSGDVLVEVVEASWDSKLISEIVDVVKAKSELLEDKIAHRLIKRVIVAESKKEEQDADACFANKLYNVLKPTIPKLLDINRACFVIAALLEHPETKTALKKQLGAKALKSKIEKSNSAGAKVILKELESK
mmetsp:Transcript_17835/g.30430  ORF Transcript_17835/g.30430 Transcript_17835/m.30430 type:complete len:529 (-) Transcript_17835:144-1730(-)